MRHKTNDRLILRLHAEGMSQRELANELNCSKTAILKRLRKLLPYGHPKYSHQGYCGFCRTKNNSSGAAMDTKIYRHLRIIGTKYVFPWSEYLASKDFMEEVVWDGEKLVVVTQARGSNR